MRRERTDGPERTLAILASACMVLGGLGLSLVPVARGLEVDHDGDGSPASLARTVALAKAASFLQARELGWNLPAVASPAFPSTGSATPSEAVFALLARHAVTPTPEEDRAVRSLDALPEPARTAVARWIEAFMAFEDAARAAFARADADLLARLDEHARAGAAETPSEPRFAPTEAGLDLSEVFAARNALLDAALEVDRAFRTPALPSGQASSESTLQIPPVLSLDLVGASNTYATDFALLLDVGGDDVYLNNAGGTGGLPNDGFGCGLFDMPLFLHASAALDLRGDDRYESGRKCGVNGGGIGGAGFLMDAAGSDTYTAGNTAANGGGDGGTGFLLDGGGRDTYTAGNWGTNGGGASDGVGFLLDRRGDDTYTAGGVGTNGGSSSGSGRLLDLDGNDRYTASQVDTNPPGDHGTNGGGSLGIGTLLDTTGADVYILRNPAGAVISNRQDETVAPKGIGAQIDLPGPSIPRSNCPVAPTSQVQICRSGDTNAQILGASACDPARKAQFKVLGTRAYSAEAGLLTCILFEEFL